MAVTFLVVDSFVAGFEQIARTEALVVAVVERQAELLLRPLALLEFVAVYHQLEPNHLGRL